VPFVFADALMKFAAIIQFVFAKSTPDFNPSGEIIVLTTAHTLFWTDKPIWRGPSSVSVAVTRHFV